MVRNTNATYRSVTQAYYSAWLGVDDLTSISGVRSVYSPERNVCQRGYPSRFDIYLWLQPERVIVSYGDAAAPMIPALMAELEAMRSASAVKELLWAAFSLEAKHSIKYLYENAVQSPMIAQTLTLDQYSDYADFFAACNPSGNRDWLREYFEEMVRSRYCVGIFQEGRLVSCTDAPDMPYLAIKVQEIGINTLMEYRGKGFAAAACIACAQNILASGKVPLWSTGVDNVASQKTAERVAFVKFADVLTVTVT